MKSRSAKNKGKRLQNNVRDLLLETFNQLEPDLICNPDFEEPFRFDLSKYKKAVELKGDSWKVVSRSKTKQMDVVAFYGKHAFIIECKHTDEQSSSSDLGAQIDEFAIRSHFISLVYSFIYSCSKT